jgi:hypothetical protein
MSQINKFNELFISKKDFDHEFYLDNNHDIKDLFKDKTDAYKHWIIHGCHEDRPVKSYSDKSCRCVKIPDNIKFKIVNGDLDNIIRPRNILTPTIIKKHEKKKLNYNLALMIHAFDIIIFQELIKYINQILAKYDSKNIHIYINIVEEDNKYPGCLKTKVSELIDKIASPYVFYFYTENRGADIGGFIFLSKIILESEYSYKYQIFMHTKTNNNWRRDLCNAITSFNLATLDHQSSLGIAGSKKWIHQFGKTYNKYYYEKFGQHLEYLHSFFDISESDKTNTFVAGTMFIINNKILEFINKHDIYDIYTNLNKINTVDANWLHVVVNLLHLNPKGCGNDLLYRLKYKDNLVADFMLEHTFERFFGIIAAHLKLNIIGI